MTSAVKDNEKNNIIEDNHEIKRPIKKHKTHKVKKIKKNNKIPKNNLKISKVINNENLDNKSIKIKKKSDSSRKITSNKSDIPFKTTKTLKLGADKKKNETKKILELKDFELNSLEYEEALKLDKRNYFQYYFSLIKNNHPLIVSFIPFKDYNSFIIKMFRNYLI